MGLLSRVEYCITDTVSVEEMDKPISLGLFMNTDYMLKYRPIIIIVSIINHLLGETTGRDLA